MENKFKIKISNTAYDKLLTLLSNHGEYEAVRFSLGAKGCCKSPVVDIVLDTAQVGDIEEKIENLSILYSPAIKNTLKEITLVLKNNSFLVKTVPLENPKSNCAQCPKKNLNNPPSTSSASTDCNNGCSNEKSACSGCGCKNKM